MEDADKRAGKEREREILLNQEGGRSGQDQGLLKKENKTFAS
jgi:hypothetical protein